MGSSHACAVVPTESSAIYRPLNPIVRNNSPLSLHNHTQTLALACSMIPLATAKIKMYISLYIDFQSVGGPTGTNEAVTLK